MASVPDVLVVGSGPAGLAIAAALGRLGVRVVLLAAARPPVRWPNTYGIWCDELAATGFGDALSHRWDDTVAYGAADAIALNRAYGLFDNTVVQQRLLAICEHTGVTWQRGVAAAVAHHAATSLVQLRDGRSLAARLVIDASGHTPFALQRPVTPLAYQAAYGIVGTFRRPPVEPGRMVLMDYRAEHLTNEQRRVPTFLYAMDLGDGRYFVEETSLAQMPGVQFAELEQRLHRRLAAYGTAVCEVQHVERCFFPMNAPLPDLQQPLFGYGAAAAMVHPVSGYMVGAVLRHAPVVAAAIASVLGAADATPTAAARAGWQALWPPEAIRRRQLYLFGLACLVRMETTRLQAFFETFFQLPYSCWSGYLSDRHTTPALLETMLRLFAAAPGHVRATLVGTANAERSLLLRAFTRYSRVQQS
ncbi:MAG TPA: lycopene cyclase family protein [Roseiflexaceae bacterium]|nr:lycopene cyclase family protein [Roseiflexaceae bacterium]